MQVCVSIAPSIVVMLHPLLLCCIDRLHVWLFLSWTSGNIGSAMIPASTGGYHVACTRCRCGQWTQRATKMLLSLKVSTNTRAFVHFVSSASALCMHRLHRGAKCHALYRGALLTGVAQVGIHPYPPLGHNLVHSRNSFCYCLGSHCLLALS